MSVPVPFIPNIEFELSRHPPPLYKQKDYKNENNNGILDKYINDPKFCYLLLFNVRNNKKNQTKELLAITSEIAKHYKIVYQYNIYFGFKPTPGEDINVDVADLKITIKDKLVYEEYLLPDLFDLTTANEKRIEKKATAAAKEEITAAITAVKDSETAEAKSGVDVVNGWIDNSKKAEKAEADKTIPTIGQRFQNATDAGVSGVKNVGNTVISGVKNVVISGVDFVKTKIEIPRLKNAEKAEVKQSKNAEAEEDTKARSNNAETSEASNARSNNAEKSEATQSKTAEAEEDTKARSNNAETSEASNARSNNAEKSEATQSKNAEEEDTKARSNNAETSEALNNEIKAMQHKVNQKKKEPNMAQIVEGKEEEEEEEE